MTTFQQTERVDRRLFLKIKLINLADEARTIRRMEKRAPDLRNELCDHRKGIVRSESRHTLLAYGFLRGRSLAQIGAGKLAPDWKKVEAMVVKYGPKTPETLKKFQEWKA